MSTLELLAELRQLGVQLSTDGDKLKCKAPNDALTPRLRSALADRKAEIINFLHEGAQDIGLTLGQIPVADRAQNLPLSFSQQRLWFLDQIEPNNSSYNIPEAVQLDGELNLPVLQQTLDAIVAHHEVLRTTYQTIDSHPIQVINQPDSVVIEIVDLQHLPPTEQPAQIQAALVQSGRKPFALDTDLMLRCCLVKLAPNQHIFLATMHHIASDAWSMGLFWQQLGQVYSALAAHQPNPLLPLPIQYADYAVWQREWLSGEIITQQLDYWKQQLTDVNPILKLPTDYPRPAIQTYAGKIISSNLSPQLTADLKALCRQEGATLFMTLLGTFELLMSRHSGQEDFIIAAPIAGRNRIEVEESIGFFINTLLLSADLSGNPTFKQLLQRVRTVALGAYSHQDVPFEKLIEELNPRRDLSRNPLFQVLFNLLNTEDVQLELADLTATPVTIAEANSKFDVTLYAKEVGSQLHFDLAYNTNLFTPERMQELLAQFEYLLTQIVADPDRQIQAYSLVTPAARAILPDPRVALPQPVYPPITTTITDWATRTPQQIAIIQADQSWTYQELVTAAQAIARSLQSAQLEIGDAVAVSGDRSFGLIASMLGVLIGGGVLVNIFPALPMARQNQLLSTTQAKYLLAAGELPSIADLSLDRIQVFEVDPDTAAINSDKVVPDNLTASLLSVPPDAAAYIFFTSGTTGVPKGVLGTHQGLAHFLTWQRETFAVTPADRSAQLTGMSFDVVMRDVFLPLTSGATLCLPGVSEDLTAGKVLPWLERNQITLLHTVPAMIQTWLLTVPPGVSLGKLRQIFFAGEPLTQTLIQQWRDTFPLAGEVVNLYGPTETTLAKCYYRVPAQLRAGVQPVGTTLPATQALVLKSDHQLCGIGETGEIAIRTPFRTRGYLNGSEAERSKFVINPDRSAPEDLVYHTGDRGRYLPDGQLEILGRIDRQIKIGGVRIEPGEIAAILSRHPQVQTAIVIAREDLPGDKRLVGYYVSTDSHQIPVGDLREFLGQELPTFMIPSAFILLAALPLTANGKIDSRALPAPVRDLQANSAGLSPRDEFEIQLTKIWERVLGVKSISLTDNFFELGGHSLLAIRLFSEIEQVWGRNLPLATLFQAQTIEKLANLLRQSGWSTPYSSLVPIQPEGSKPPLFCVHPIGGNILEYYALASHLDKDQPVYGIQSLGLDGKATPLDTIEAMATYYIAEMKIIQPCGPYYLVGYSFAGLVVYEIARQLDRQGERVGLLALLDRLSPTFVSCRSESALEIFKIHLSNLSLLDYKGKLRYVIGRLKYRFIHKRSFRSYMLAEWDNALPPSYVDVFDANLTASDKYQNQRQSYAGNLTLFRCEVQPLNQALSVDLCWRDLVTGTVEIYPVVAAHYNMLLEPNVQSLAQQLQLCIGKAQIDNQRSVD